jgi:hypothetical protein
MSRFGLFNEFLKEHGWKNHYDAKNRILRSVKIKEDAVLDFDELPSWKSFYLYWSCNFPRLKIPKPSQDICGECYIYANKIRFKQQSNPGSSKRSLASLLQEDSDNDDTFFVLPEQEDEDHDAEQEQMIKSEDIIDKASIHVKRAKHSVTYSTERRRKQDPPSTCR